jgi:hypothetical protein
MAAISKLEPHRSIYLRGFDRRGAAAAMTNASAGGFTVSGCWSDQADFAVCVLFDADDQFGHLYTSRYLPDFSLAGVTLDFDLTLIGCQSPASQKYQSVPWGSLSYITRTVSGGAVTEIQGSVSLLGGAAAGGTSATATVTLSGTPATGDRLYIYYLGNTGYDTGIGQSYSVATGDSVADVAAKLAGLVATLHSTDSTTYPLTASNSGADVMFTAPVGADGNDIALLAMAAGGTTFTPTWLFLGGGTDPASIHVHLDFSALGLASARQVWLTLAPPVSPQYGSFPGCEWSAVFSNWTVGDPGGVTPLKLAGPGSVTITSGDSWATRAGNGWTQVAGWYVGGFAWQSAHSGDAIMVKYSCQSVHNLYWGTALSTAGGAISVSVDGGAAMPVSAYSTQSSGAPTAGRRLIASGIAAGTHAVVLTVASGTCLFDYLQAAILSDPVAPPATYPAVSCACDFDTGQTYQIAPARLLWILSQAGFTGDIDFYAGVFFALKRVRNGGHFRQATVTLSLPPLTPVSGTVWITVGGATGSGTPLSGDTSTGGNPTGSGVLGGTVFGAAAISCDTLLTIARRLANAINGMFVGIWAAASISTPGQLIIAVLSPINGFSLDVSLSSDSTLTLSVTGDIGIGGVGGNEGTWAVAPTKNAAAGVVPETAPLNRAFVDYLTDLAASVKAAGQTMTVAFSQELLAPPDLQTCAAPSVTFGFFNYFGTGYVHQITVGANTYSYTQLAGDGSGDIANALTALVRGDPNASAFVSANNVSLITAGPGLVACSASDGNGPGTLASSAWCQRFANGATVLTATGFGSWGAGVVDGVSGSGPQTVEQIGHGYVTGNTVHVAQGSDGAVWSVTVTDADHYQLTTLVSGTAFTVAPGATTLIDLQTAQCCFNPATVTAYLQNCYLQAAGILSAAGLVPWLQLGEVGWWFFSRLMNEAVGYASWTDPISIGTVAAHGLATGENAIVAAVGGTTAANGTFPIVVTDATHFSETGSSGNAAYIAGGTVSGGGMAYYDPYTAAAALTVLGRALASFWTQDDDPSVNSHADANFLRSLVYAHMHTIAQAVKAAYAGAKIEWLLPLDTNNPTVYWNAGYPYPQGGRMNNYVNIPSQYMAPNGDIDRVKLEALSWGASYLNLDLAKAAMAYGHAVLTYAKPATAYLIPWYNGACAWTAQYLAAVNAGIPLVYFWAVDHLTMLSWPLPLPINKRRARLF